MKIIQHTLPWFGDSHCDHLKDEKLPTNASSHRHRVHRWANFIAGYSIEFVEKCLVHQDNTQDIVIDPFLGCGTTLIAARNMGFQGIGYDRHDLFYTLAGAKLNNYSISELQKIKEEISSSQTSIKWSNDAITFLTKLFKTEDLEKISQASYAIDQFKGNKLHPLAVTLLVKACELSCGSQTDGIYKAPTSKKRSVGFKEAIECVYNTFLEDISSEWYKNYWLNQPLATCFHKSSISMQEVDDFSAGICITSPPYLNNFDYAEMTRMQLYLLGWATSWKDISQSIRNQLITNTTTALKNKRTDEYQNNQKYSLPQSLISELDQIVLQLEIERKTRLGKKEYNLLIYPYYAEINKVLRELHRIMKPNGTIHWVIADAALYGVHIKTHLHTKQLLENLGFQEVKINFLRKRGHRWILNKRDGAKEGLAEYHITAIK